MQTENCVLCHAIGGELIWQNDKLRLIRADEPGFPAFYRLIWNLHIAEMSSLSQPERSYCIETITKIERVLLQRLRPDKINLASLGNMVPHLHWHIIARFDWDSHYPASVWSTAERAVDNDKVQHIYDLLPQVHQDLVAILD